MQGILDSQDCPKTEDIPKSSLFLCFFNGRNDDKPRGNLFSAETSLNHAEFPTMIG